MSDYNSIVASMFERHRSVQTAGFSGSAYKPGLEQMRDYAASLGNPEQAFRSIHVAGTNGKGSVCSMLAAAIAARGLRTGLYTSPHLLDFRERIKLVTLTGDRSLYRRTSASLHPSHLFEAGPSRSRGHGRPRFSGQRPGPGEGAAMIPEEAVCAFMERYDREGLSFFEVTTGMAFKWFADSAVDVAVIETGLGGRLDSTNIITPELSIITSIGLDHCELLGNTRAEIAAEKAGIFKPGVPALVWGRDPETAPVFTRIAAEKGSPLYFAEDYTVPDGLQPDLSGPCSELNLRTVIAALSILGDDSPDLEAVCSAARITGLHGRWEQLLADPPVICDIGHNPPALEHNFARLAAMGRHMLVVYGVMADKDIDSIVHFMPQQAEYFLTAPATPRAMGVKDLALKLKNLNFTESGSVARGVQDALLRARELPDPVVYIGGSTFVVSEALSYFQGV